MQNKMNEIERNCVVCRVLCRIQCESACTCCIVFRSHEPQRSVH